MVILLSSILAIREVLNCPLSLFNESLTNPRRTDTFYIKMSRYDFCKWEKAQQFKSQRIFSTLLSLSEECPRYSGMPWGKKLRTSL